MLLLLQSGPAQQVPLGMVPLLHTGVPWLAPPREALILRSSPMGLVSRRARELQYKLHAAPLTLCSTSLLNRACMVVMDAGPDWLAPLAPPAPYGLRGVWVVQRAVALPPSRGVLRCQRASEHVPAVRRGRLRRSSQRRPSASPPLIVS